MREAVAYLITWRTYGTWLHGDARGSVDREHNIPGTPLLARDAGRAARSAGRMTQGAVELDRRGREIVAGAVREHCQHRGWELLALAVHSNHVHAVIAAGEARPERVLGALKARATRRLRADGWARPKAHVWAYHGSTRYLWDSKSVEAAAAYVSEGQEVPR